MKCYKNGQGGKRIVCDRNERGKGINKENNNPNREEEDWIPVNGNPKSLSRSRQSNDTPVRKTRQKLADGITQYSKNDIANRNSLTVREASGVHGDKTNGNEREVVDSMIQMSGTNASSHTERCLMNN